MHLHNVFVCVSSAALLLAMPAAAAEPATSPSNQASAPTGTAPAHATKRAPDEPKKICRTIDTLSSRLRSKKVCLTREQWRNAKYN